MDFPPLLFVPRSLSVCHGVCLCVYILTKTAMSVENNTFIRNIGLSNIFVN